MPTTRSDSASERPDAVDAAAVDAALREWAEAHRERELERALRALERAGGLTDGQRGAVAALSQSLTDELLGPPLAAVADDETAAAYVAELFDLDES